MAQDAARTILTVGIVGVGGYIFYQYTQYQSGIANFNKVDPTGNTAAQIESALPFMSYVILSLGFSQPSSAGEAAALGAMRNAISGTLVMPPTPTPGATPTMTAASSPTSVSTTPTTTPTTQGSAGGTAAATASVQQPTAADLQHTINMSLATADQWNYGYKQLMGTGIESVYGFNFDTVYGALQAGGRRSSGMLTAQAFLSAPTTMGVAHTVTTPRPGFHGMGAIAHFYTPVVRSSGSMIYRAQHPSPYRNPMTNLAGFTQPTGFEMALLGRQTLRSNKLI